MGIPDAPATAGLAVALTQMSSRDSFWSSFSAWFWPEDKSVSRLLPMLSGEAQIATKMRLYMEPEYQSVKKAVLYQVVYYMESALMYHLVDITFNLPDVHKNVSRSCIRKCVHSEGEVYLHL